VTGPSPLVRVVDATLVDEGGPARMVITGLPRAREVADKVAAARGVCRFVDERLHVQAVPDRLVDAAGRVGRAPLAELLRGVVEPAIAAWCGEPPDVVTPAGVLPCGSRPVVLGILNVTPDSFSDGGSYEDVGAAVAAGRAMVAAGADAVDVGGESTRPGAEPVAEDQELQRVVPVVSALVDAGAIVSVDTSKAAVARAAVAAGAAMVNDVSAGAFDPALLPTVAELGVPYVLMHLRGEPRTMQHNPTYGDVTAEVFEYLAERVSTCQQQGIAADRLVIDPGLGFGKTLEHNLALLGALRQLTSLGRPVLLGASRKAFIGTISQVDAPAERLAGSLAAASLAVAAGVRLLRVHDVAETVQAVRVAHAITDA
jgi:dihydropteroate synthase